MERDRLMSVVERVMATTDPRVTPLVIVFEIPATLDALEQAVARVEVACEDLPPEIQPAEGSSFHIHVRHDDDCTSRESRSMADCSCETLVVEATLLSDEQAEMLEESGEFDLMVAPGKRPGSGMN